ncbi:phage tail protein [Brevibacillus migulae]|uniref:phage tail protein n=1 Tax=Brevibacillus migulae TaxID=1644114 RepID=UPI00106ED805|nr:tail fiber protein [Brevibacillus migulae]
MESYIGEIRMFAGNFAPAGWALCNGQLLSISENEPLFMLLGTTYGGDGQTTFALPDLRGRIPIHTGQNPRSGTSFALGQMGGTETVTLTTGQLPMHTHVPLAASTGTSNSPAGSYWAGELSIYSTEAPDGQMDPALLGSTGGGQPHDNVMPYTAVNFIISLYGIYPSQN